ncbi:hypothetical protein SAURM35S_07657 [Streptomyces aurantiogriseus]
MVVLVVGDHLHGAAEVGMVGEVLAEQFHLLGGALLGDPAVGEVRDDVLHGQRLVGLELVVGESDAALFQEHGVVGLGRDGDGFEAALLHQGVEDPPVLVLVGAVPGDLGGEGALALRDERRDPGVLPAALGLAAGGDGAEQPERLVVVEDLLEQALGRKHREAPLCIPRDSAGFRKERVKCGAMCAATAMSDNSAKRMTPPSRRRRNRAGPGALFSVTAVAGKTPEPPPRPLKSLSPQLRRRPSVTPGRRAPGPAHRPAARRGARRG